MLPIRKYMPQNLQNDWLRQWDYFSSTSFSSNFKRNKTSRVPFTSHIPRHKLGQIIYFIYGSGGRRAKCLGHWSFFIGSKAWLKQKDQVKGSSWIILLLSVCLALSNGEFLKAHKSSLCPLTCIFSIVEDLTLYFRKRVTDHLISLFLKNCDRHWLSALLQMKWWNRLIFKIIEDENINLK